MSRPNTEATEPEHISSILKRVLLNLESQMSKDFDPQLSLKIDSVFFLLDSLNPRVAPALIGECPEHSPTRALSGRDNDNESS